MRLRNALLLSVAVAGVGLLGAWRLDGVRDAEREAAIEASRVRGWARANASVGVSVLPKRIPEADDAVLRRVRSLPGFDAYAGRCASCHALPDPRAYSPRRWIGKVDEMREHIREAGVMPPAAGELESAIEFLGAASEALQGGG